VKNERSREPSALWDGLRATMERHGVDTAKATDADLQKLLLVELPREIGEIYAAWATNIRGAVSVFQKEIAEMVPTIEGFSEAVTALPSPKELHPSAEEMN
jgi:hypothetical protein